MTAVSAGVARGDAIIGIDFGRGDKVGLALMQGGRMIEPKTVWASLGSDQSRHAFFDVIETGFGIALTDDDRESVRTVGDLTSLIERRVA